MKVTRIIKTNHGILEVSNTEKGCFVKFEKGDNQWHRIDGASYEYITQLGNGWFYLTQYWEGCNLPIETPFQVQPVQIFSESEPQGLDAL